MVAIPCRFESYPGHKKRAIERLLFLFFIRLRQKAEAHHKPGAKGFVRKFSADEREAYKSTPSEETEIE